jgi:hypothetical protein
MAGIMSIDMPGFLQGVNYLSPQRYAVRNLAPYSLRGIHFTCNDAQRLPNGECPITNGTQVLDLYALNTNPARNIMALGVCTVIYRLFAYLLLKAMRMHWGDSKGGERKGSQKNGGQRMQGVQRVNSSEKRTDTNSEAFPESIPKEEKA